MEEKISLNLFYMGLISAILAALCSGFAFFNAFRTQVREDLQQQAQLIASAYEELDDPGAAFPVFQRRVAHYADRIGRNRVI